MYKKVLVPLDGSELAECALSHVKNLVKDGAADEIIILNVFNPYFPMFEEKDFSTYGDMTATRKKMRNDSIKYLADVESRLRSEGIKVKTEMLMGSRPAEVISDYVRNNDISLMVISTHGYTGLKKLMFGSVALEILHNSHAPVLLIRPESCRS